MGELAGDRPPRRREKDLMARPMTEIRVQNLRCALTIQGSVQEIVGPVSFGIKGGEFLAVAGPPRCGKTTLLKMLAGLRPTAGGEISSAGFNLQPPHRNFGLVLQDPGLLPWRTSIRNILLQTEIRGLDFGEAARRARHLLAWFGLAGYEKRRPHELPHGAAQIVSICRAMIHAPGLLLMDDPFLRLDPIAREKALDAFQRLWTETRPAVLLCTSDIHQAILLSDRVVVLSSAPGRVLDDFEVDLPRPRRLDRASILQMADYCGRIRTLFRAQGVLP